MGPLTRRIRPPVLLLIAGLATLGPPLVSSRSAGADKPAAAALPRSFASQPAPGTRARCPVSGDTFTITGKTQTSTYKGRVYAFCCSDCKPDFDKDPAKYEDKGGAKGHSSKK